MISNLVGRQRHDLVRDISSLGSLIFYILAMTFSFFLQQYYLFYRLLIGLAIIYAVTLILKSLFFKERPIKLKHESFIEKLDAASFPSLHASRTAFMAAILINFFDNSKISVLMILLALIIAYSRIYLKKHDWKDVSAGIVLGTIVYFAVSFIY